MRKVSTSEENATAAGRLRTACFNESEAIFAKAAAQKRRLTLAETKRIRELTKAIDVLMVTVTPEDMQETVIVVRPQRTGIFLKDKPEEGK